MTPTNSANTTSTSTASTSTKTLTSRLALFFLLLSTALVSTIALAIIGALHWSEDKVGERLNLIAQKQAMERFNAGESGHIKIDQLTDAYNDLELVPEAYRIELEKRESYLGEMGEDPHSRMVFMGSYWHKGETKKLILLSQVDTVEMTGEERVIAIILVLLFFAILLFTFAVLLIKLSKQIIAPVNTLSEQLSAQCAVTAETFEIGNDSAVEFALLADKLNQYRDKLGEVLKQEQAFARYASHELNTPLTVVMGATNLLKTTELNEFQRRQIARADDAARQMNEIISALLELVRYEQSPDASSMRSLEQHELEKIIAQCRPQADQKKLELALNIIELPQLNAGEAVLNMVISNMLRNAIAASEAGTIQINATADKLEVIDQGVGLKSAPNREGHGLGLLVIQDLCQRYGWQFDLHNCKERGSCARITFVDGND